MNINPYNLTIFFGALLLVFVAILKLVQIDRRNKIPWFFYGFIATANLTIIQVLLIDFGISKKYPLIYLFYLPYQYVSPVLFTGFTCYYLEKKTAYQKHQKLLWLPAILFFIGYQVLIVNTLLDYQLFSKHISTFITTEVDENLAVVFSLFLGIYNYRVIRNYEYSLGTLSFIYVIKKTKWIKNIFIVSIVLCIFWLLTVVLFYIDEEIRGNSPYYPIWILFVSFYSIIVIFGSKHLRESTISKHNTGCLTQHAIKSFPISALQEVFSENGVTLMQANPARVTSILNYFASSLVSHQQEKVLEDVAETSNSSFVLKDGVCYMKDPSEKVLPQRPACDSKKNDGYIKELHFLMKEAKLYRDAHLGLESLSKRLNISGNYLSKIVNKSTGKNFTDYVNSFRVEDTKSKLKDPEFANYTIYAIALESGFNSKSTFYTAFKKHTGISPTKYRKTS